jgi:hypothetical protein
MRYDRLKLSALLLPIIDAQELSDLSDLEFQTKDLDKEFLDYQVGSDGYLYFEDFEYEMTPTDNKEGLFSIELKKINQTIKKSYHTGKVIFYGKPYETFYRFEAYFHDGKLKAVTLLSKSLGTNQ